MKNVSALILVSVLLAASMAGGDLGSCRLPTSSTSATEQELPEPGTTTDEVVMAPRIGSSTTPEHGIEDEEAAGPATPSDATDPTLASVLAWAAGRYERAGLTMPGASVHVHDRRSECQDHVAIFIGTEPTPEIHLCFEDDAPPLVRKRVTLHELAHVWTHQYLSDADRTRFLTLRRLDHWGEPARWYQQGAEHAAEIMAWGLLEEDIGVLTIAPNDRDSLVVSFRFLTGVDPICVPQP